MKKSNVLHERFDREDTIPNTSSRSFGLVVGSMCIVVGLYRWWTRDELGIGWWVLGFLLVGSGLIYPRVLRVPSLLWSKLGIALNRITSPLVVSVLFFGMMAPMGILLRLLRKDLLGLRFQPNAKSYWIPKEQSTSYSQTMRHLF